MVTYSLRPRRIVAVSEKSLANLRPFKPGEVHNAGGRPKGVIEQIKGLTNNGKDLLRVLAECALGDMPGAKARDRIDAARYLCDRVYGKPLESTITAQITDTTRFAALELTKEQLEA